MIRHVLIVLCLAPAFALADAPTNREDDMFGGPADAKAAEAPKADAAKAEAAGREDDMFGGDVPTKPEEKPADPGDRNLERVDTNAMDSLMADRNDRLQIGGRVFVRTSYGAQQKFDADVPDLDPGTFALTSPNLFDIYFDARPNDQLRAYMRTRTVYDPSIIEGRANQFGQTQSRLRTNIDQLWVKLDAYQKVFFTIGKQRIKWGTGRFWNPTDFLNSTVLDPLSVIDERLGVSLVKAHIPIESLGWNLYAIVDLEGAAQANDVGGALRGEFLLGPVEAAISFHGKEGAPQRLGLDLSSALWIFDLRVEGAVTHPNAKGIVQRVTKAININDPTTWDGVEDLKGEWIPQVVASAEVSLQYSEQDSVNLSAEYFYNGLGYDDATLYDTLFLRSLLAGSTATSATGGGALTSTRRAIGSSFQPLYMGKHYLAASVALVNPGDWNNSVFFASYLGNLSTKTHNVRVQGSWTLLTSLSANLFASYTFGDTGDLNYGLRIDPITNPILKDRVPAALAGGFVINPSVFQVGGGLILSI